MKNDFPKTFKKYFLKKCCKINILKIERYLSNNLSKETFLFQKLSIDYFLKQDLGKKLIEKITKNVEIVSFQKFFKTLSKSYIKNFRFFNVWRNFFLNQKNFIWQNIPKIEKWLSKNFQKHFLKKCKNIYFENWKMPFQKPFLFSYFKNFP